jgi:TATA-box binding protein (TBP) (component of TFIID and TFIIIB)
MFGIIEISKTVHSETLKSGSRSNKRLKIAHDMIASDILEKCLKKDEIVIRRLSEDERFSHEEEVPYGVKSKKKVDFAIFKKGKLVFTGGTKFIENSYNKNSNNYCESEFSQAALLSKNTPYFSITTIPKIVPIDGSFEVAKHNELYLDIEAIPNVLLCCAYIDNFEKIDYNYGKSYEELISKIAEVLNE